MIVMHFGIITFLQTLELSLSIIGAVVFLEFYQEIKILKTFSTFFETNHDLTAEPISKLFNFEYTSASSNGRIRNGFRKFLQPKFPSKTA